ncbi:hypothetical protein JD844_018733 [Phrynosoma platyrhinos]|uniref:Helicase C-terminal domain-containing protein n=1 Tax=Phrynosoma platyrhinos TaxID=52577 RepID=A0ABQ7SP74_PHRPL|nr:hypothetical protein JD844_018733 [Phrynosoma platyrhinos]
MAAPVGPMKFWKPGTDGPGANLSEERQSPAESASVSVIYNPYVSLSIEQQRQKLPVFKLRNHILYLVENYQTLVIVGETGCGKSTQIPQIAGRVAEERGALLGHEVGYCIRFDDCTDLQATRIKFLTDGMLVREMMADPLLTRYSVIMLDEAHERTLYTDIAIGLLKKGSQVVLDSESKGQLQEDLPILTPQPSAVSYWDRRTLGDEADGSAQEEETDSILKSHPNVVYNPVSHWNLMPVDPETFQSREMTSHLVQAQVHRAAFSEPPTPPPWYQVQKKRGDLRLIVASATMDAEKFRDFFNQNETSDPSKDTSMILTVEGRTFPVDVFYIQSPVPDYVKSTVETVMKIHQTEGDGDILAFLTGQEEVETVVSMLIEQARIFARTGMKKHLRVLPMYAGLPASEQMKVFERVSHNVRKVIVATNIAETSITINGISFVIDCGFVKLRAYNPKTAIECLVVVPVSKASANQRAGRAGRNRSGKCYRLYTEEDFEKLPQSTIPEMQRSNLAPVILQLKALGIDNVLRFPFLSIREHRKFAVEEGDHLTMLNVYEAFIKHSKNSQWCQDHFLNYKGLVRATAVREQLKKLLVKFKVPKKSCEGDPDPVLRCIVSGFFANAARFHSTGAYRTIRDDHELHIHPTSVLYAEKPPRWVVYNEVIQTSKYYMRDVTAIESSWLLELAPHFYQQGTFARMV